MSNRTGSTWVSLEMLRWVIGRGRFTLPVLAQAAVERVSYVMQTGSNLIRRQSVIEDQVKQKIF